MTQAVDKTLLLSDKLASVVIKLLLELCLQHDFPIIKLTVVDLLIISV